jgi:hypothetical protein
LFLENRLKYYNNGVGMLRTTPVCLAWLLALAVALHPSPASAVSNRVKKVKTLYKQLFFDDATKVCRSVLDAGHNRREDLVELLKYKGLLAAVQGNNNEATKAFRQLLVIEPEASLGEGHPPRVERAFAAAQRWFRRQRPLTATPRAPASVLREGTVEISLEVTDPLTMVSQAVLHIRAEGARRFKRHLARSSAGLRWAVQVARLQGIGAARRVEYYVTLLDHSFNEVGQVGRAAAPRPIALLGPPASVAGPVVVSKPAPAPPKERRARPWYKRWWVWAAVGAAVVTAAAVGGAVGAANSPSDTVDAPVTLEATGP